jgi:hypothetical protein
MNRPTDEQLAEIRERCDKATEGPWFPSLLTEGYIAQGSEFNVVASVLEYNEDGSVRATLGNDNYENNREFIAHAREDIPLLLSEVKALRKLIEDITIIASENRYNASEQVLLQILMRIEEDDE